MTWVRLDDSFPTNPKVARLSDAAFRLYVTALCHAAQHLTDGAVEVDGLVKVKPAAVTDLVSGGLFEKTPNGLQIHDFLEFNPARAAVLDVREKKREAGSMGGRQSGLSRKQNASKHEANTKQGAKHDASPMLRHFRTPVPIPSPPSPTGDEESISEGAGSPSRTPVFSGIPEGGNGRDPFSPEAPEPVHAAARKRLVHHAWDEEASYRLTRGDQDLPPRPPPFEPASAYGPDSRNDERERLLLWEGGDDEAFTRHAFEMGPVP